ncbi:hypothetical protein ACLK17_27310 [Escherichia coli]
MNGIYLQADRRLAQQHVVYPRAVVAGWCDVGTANLPIARCCWEPVCWWWRWPA